MADVLLFHHALGLTDGVRAFADELRSAGHDVVTPDLFDGATFETIEEGVAHAESIGFDVIADRGAAAADEDATGLVAIGFSMGVLPAQKLAQTHPGVVGAVLCHAAAPPSFFGGGTFPEGLELQFHFCEADPWAEEDIETARDIAAATGAALYLYEGAGHLVAEPASSDHDADIAQEIMARTRSLLAEVT